MSFFYPRENQRFRDVDRLPGEAPQSPSLASVLSTNANAPLSSIEAIEPTEWVLFSPQVQSEVSMPEVDADAAESSVDEPLELPAHDGRGSFLEPAQTLASSASTATVRDPVDRVNMWRLDQSRLIFSELQRLERRLFATTSDHTTQSDHSSESQWQQQPKTEGPPSLWQRIGRKAIEYVTLNDRVLDAIFSPEFRSEEPHSASPLLNLEQRPLREHFERARRAGPPSWDQRLIDRLLGSPPAFPLLRRLLALLPPTNTSGVSSAMQSARSRNSHTFQTPLSIPMSPETRTNSASYWSDWETSSVGSTAVF